MFGRGNYNSQFGRGAPAPMPPPYQPQQHLPGPPPVPLCFQQGRPGPPPSVFQPATPVYQHGHPVPPPAVCQITPNVLLSTSQPYQHPQPPVHGSTTLPPMYSTDQPNTHLGNKNVHHMPTSMPPHHPQILRPPPPPTTVYRAPVHQQSQQPGGVQHLQHMPLPLPPPPPPPPLTSSSFTSNPFGSFVQSTVRNSHMHSVAPLPPPPPPSDPPPIQPSPPPLTSPLSSLMHQQAASNLSNSNQPHSSLVSTLGCGVTSCEVRLNVSQDDGSLNQEGSTIGDNLVLGGSVMLDLPPPPPRPKEEKVVQKIEDLCQLIAKNGPDYEDFVQQNESGNQEFDFLFGGDSGSEAAITHEYFLWVKKKCILACKLNEGKNDSPLRPSGTDSLIKPNILEVASKTYSPADSDMEMEDDITQSGNDLGINHSTNGKNSGYDLIHDDLDVKEQSHKEHTSESEKVAFAYQVPVEEGDKVVSNLEMLAFENPASKVYSPMINSADEQSATLLVDKIPSGATAAAQGLNSEISSQLMKDGSPFRLLHDYASDDISENDDELHPEFVSSLKNLSSVAVEATSPNRNLGLNMWLKAENFNEDSCREVKEMVMASIARRTTDERVNAKCENQTSISRAESPQDFQKKDPLDNASIQGAKCTSNSLKVDEFGRLVREGASGSDSDDSRYNRMQSKRGRSRSRSPLDRRRRSPWRRKEKRSRSRSWSPSSRRSRSRSPRNRRSRSRSPRNQRSRSRSPRNWRSRSRSPRRQISSRSPDSRCAGKFSGDGMRRERGQLPECFDFRRGRCYRGASCRYLHQDSDKGNGLKHHTSKQPYLEVPPISKISNIHEDAIHKLQKVSDQQHHEIEILEMQICQDMASSSFIAKKEMHVYQIGEDSILDASKAGNFDQDGRLINSHTIKSGRYGEAAAEILRTHVLPQEERKVLTAFTSKSCQEVVESTCPMLVGAFPSYPVQAVRDADILKSHGDASQDRLPLENPVTKPSHSILSDPLLQNTDHPQQSYNSSVSDSSPEQTSMILVNKLPSTEALPNTTDITHRPGQLPSPPGALSQGAVAQNITQPPGDYNLTRQNASQLTSGERFPSYMLPNQQSHFSLSPMASWTPLAPPPPVVSSQLQQSHLPPRNDFGSEIRPYTAQLPTMVGNFHQRAYAPTQGPNQSLSHPEDFRLKPMQPYNLPVQQFGGPGLLSKDHLTHLPTLGVNTSSSFSQGDNSHLPATFSQELSASKMHTFPGDNLPPGELLKSSSQTHPYLQQQQPSYSLHHPASVSSSSRYLPEIQQANQSSHPPDFRGSRNSTFYNPYASTFEQPLSYKFSSDVVSVGSRQATSSPNSAKAVGQNFPRSGGDQYDPLLDSIEPSSNLSKKINNLQKWEPSSDSDIMLRHSGSNKPLDVEENKKKKEIRGVALATAVDNEECGETADAEVGAVENGSQSNPIGAADMNVGETEIDQIKSPGKSKKNKESRSMKLFKVAVADFVKEVLRPSWQQGNMSKEAFKTIVKKTVDKVCGAMKSHQIPKSQAKIDQYIVSSQWKLTKLVTGYVDKYVKM